jgi:hypothetical protein
MASHQYSRCSLGRWPYWLLGASLSLVLELPANARPIERAKDEGAVVALADSKAAEAFEAYRGRHYAEAVTLYTEAYATAPNPDILYNIARIYDTKLGDRRLAVSFYRQFIVAPDAALARVRIAAQRIFELKYVEVPPPSAKRLPENAEPEGATRSARWSAPEVFGVVTASAGIVAMAAGAGFGIAAVREARTVHELCEGNMCREQRGIDATKTAALQARWSTIGFISGGVLFALGAASYFLIGGDARESDEQSAAHRIQISERAGVWSLELGGDW